MPEPTLVALVTGANRGLGLEVCRQLAARGYRVVLGARDRAKGEAAAAGLAAEGLPVVAALLDVADDASVVALGELLVSQYGRLDALVNNAAIHYDTWQQASSADLQLVREALETNTLGAWRVCQSCLPLLRTHGGRIVNVSSGAGALGELGAGTPAYSLSKAALNALTLMLARELVGSGVLVNAVCPGWVATEMGGTGGRPIPDGAAGIVWAATLPVDGPTGGFFRDARSIAW